MWQWMGLLPELLPSNVCKIYKMADTNVKFSDVETFQVINISRIHVNNFYVSLATKTCQM